MPKGHHQHKNALAGCFASAAEIAKCGEAAATPDPVQAACCAAVACSDRHEYMPLIAAAAVVLLQPSHALQRLRDYSGVRAKQGDWARRMPQEERRLRRRWRRREAERRHVLAAALLGTRSSGIVPFPLTAAVHICGTGLHTSL